MKKLIFLIALALFAVIFLFGLFNLNSIDYSRRTVHKKLAKSSPAKFSMFTQYIYSLKKSHKLPPIPTVIPPSIPVIPNNLPGIELQCERLCSAYFGHLVCSTTCKNPQALCDFARCAVQALHTKSFHEFKECCHEHQNNEWGKY